MKKGTTLFARIVVYLACLGALAICTILLPELAREESVGKPFNPYATFGFLGTAYVLATPFFVALYQTHKLLRNIDKNKTFTHQSIDALKNIKLCAVTFSTLAIAATISGVVIARSVDPGEDITFMIPLGFVLTFVPAVIAVFVAVLQRLLADAVALKSENDLIV